MLTAAGQAFQELFTPPFRGPDGKFSVAERGLTGIAGTNGAGTTAEAQASR